MNETNEKSYLRRLGWAAIVSVLFHALIVGMLSFALLSRPAYTLFEDNGPTPLTVSLARLEAPKRLVDATVPSTLPPEPSSELIAERDSKAADQSPGETDSASPKVEAVADFEDIGKGPIAPDIAPSKSSSDAKVQDRKQTPEIVQRKPSVERRQLAALQLPLDEVPSSESETDLTAPGSLGEQEPATLERRSPRARVEGGVKETGILSFEAHRNALAPYLKQVRDRVEKRWKAILQTRYSGTASTQAVLECAIGPDGTLIYVRIVDPGDSPTYAYLCKEAIEQSGPFGRFPIEIPAFFKSQNIEIRWTFSFFM